MYMHVHMKEYPEVHNMCALHVPHMYLFSRWSGGLFDHSGIDILSSLVGQLDMIYW